MASIEIECRYCQSLEVSKHGIQSGQQRYRCRKCQRSFQLEYLYNGRKKGVKEQIVVMAQNGSGVRDTSRVLQVSVNTVIGCLKKTSSSSN
jgi:transposase-like protein